MTGKHRSLVSIACPPRMIRAPCLPWSKIPGSSPFPVPRKLAWPAPWPSCLRWRASPRAQTLAKDQADYCQQHELARLCRVPVTDPDTGATMKSRITTPGPLGAGLACQRAYCTPPIFERAGLEHQRILLLIANGCNGLCFLDGRTYVRCSAGSVKASANGTRAIPSA